VFSSHYLSGRWSSSNPVVLSPNYSSKTSNKDTLVIFSGVWPTSISVLFKQKTYLVKTFHKYSPWIALDLSAGRYRPFLHSDLWKLFKFPIKLFKRGFRCSGTFFIQSISLSCPSSTDISISISWISSYCSYCY